MTQIQKLSEIPASRIKAALRITNIKRFKIPVSVENGYVYLGPIPGAVRLGMVCSDMVYPDYIILVVLTFADGSQARIVSERVFYDRYTLDDREPPWNDTHDPNCFDIPWRRGDEEHRVQFAGYVEQCEDEPRGWHILTRFFSIKAKDFRWRFFTHDPETGKKITSDDFKETEWIGDTSFIIRWDTGLGNFRVEWQRVSLKYKDTIGLRPGDMISVVLHDPFSMLHGGSARSDKMNVPRSYPDGGQWSEFKIEHLRFVQPQQWPVFLRSLVGKYPDEIDTEDKVQSVFEPVWDKAIKQPVCVGFYHREQLISFPQNIPSEDRPNDHPEWMHLCELDRNQWLSFKRLANGLSYSEMDTTEKVLALIEESIEQALSTPITLNETGNELSNGLRAFHRNYLRDRHFECPFKDPTRGDLWKLFCLAVEGRLWSEIDDEDKIQIAVDEKWDEILQTPFWLDAEREVVTNGWHEFPVDRPFGAEWRSKWLSINFAKVVVPDNWALFIETIIGRCYDQTLIIKRFRQTRKNKMILERKRQRQARVIKKNIDIIRWINENLFDNPRGEQLVGIGERIMLTGERSGQEMFVVNSANKDHGFYIFLNRRDAFAWAVGETDYIQARLEAEFWTPHIGDWKGRVAAALVLIDAQVA